MKVTTINKFYPMWTILPVFIIYSIFFIIPNVYSLFLGFTDWTLFDFYNIQFNGIDNYKRLFAEDAFGLAIRNTLLFTIVTVILKVVLGILFALLANRKSIFQNFVRSFMFIPVMTSTIVVAIVFGAILNPTNGILNQFLRFIGLGALAQEWLFDKRFAMLSICLMEVWQWVGFGMLIFLAGLQGVPKDLLEASKIDGANPLQRFWSVTWPLLMPSLNIVLTFSLISGMKVFAQVYALTDGGPAGATQVLGTYLYKSFADGYLGYSSAVGFVFTIVVVTITFMFLAIARKREVEL